MRSLMLLAPFLLVMCGGGSDETESESDSPSSRPTSQFDSSGTLSGGSDSSGGSGNAGSTPSEGCDLSGSQQVLGKDYQPLTANTSWRYDNGQTLSTGPADSSFEFDCQGVVLTLQEVSLTPAEGKPSILITPDGVPVREPAIFYLGVLQDRLVQASRTAVYNPLLFCELVSKANVAASQNGCCVTAEALPFSAFLGSACLEPSADPVSTPSGDYNDVVDIVATGDQQDYRWSFASGVGLVQVEAGETTIALVETVRDRTP